MDESGGGSTGLVVGPGRGEDKRSYSGPQAEAEDNVDHQASQRSIRYEEVAGRTHSHTDIEEGAPSSNGTSPRVGSGRHCVSKR
jgi:hypothetical protein